jgi:EAL domain-containing protein (putative c-di-GMP-specific phosphodiesterase class I)
VSGRQLGEADLMDHVAATLTASGLEPARLKLEITEHALIGDVAGARRLLDGVRALGVAWSLDDFGTGYSSLSALHQLGVNTLKVDRSFVSALGSGGSTGSVMVRAIISLAHALSMDVVAEGVETAEQAAELRALGCEYAQGFYFSPGVDTLAATRLIASQPWQGARHSVAS